MYKHVHMVGIGGAGMSAIAKVLLERGFSVSGSDLMASDTTTDLAASGAQVFIGHDAAQVAGADIVVVSTAIPPGNPEVDAARAAGVPVWHRSEMLAEILNAKHGVAVAGSHGKTTITSMLAWVLQRSGRQPTFMIGGYLPGLGGAHYGAGPVVVAEADESDKSFLRYRPRIAVVTSIEADHLEYYEGRFDKIVETFRQFLANVVVPQGLAVLCGDDPHLKAIGPELGCRVVWYGREADGDYRADDIQPAGMSMTYRVVERGVDLGRFRLIIPGEHNVMNSLAVIAVCRDLGLAAEEIARELAGFPGARRRFEIVGTARDVIVVDDYAHHPAKIKATIQAARAGWPAARLIVVFQPQRYTRTHFLLDEFAASFAGADLAVLTDIYSPPPDTPIPGVSGERLAALAREKTPQLPVEYIAERSMVAPYLARQVRPGDIVLTMGAGDIWRTARELAELLRA